MASNPPAACLRRAPTCPGAGERVPHLTVDRGHPPAPARALRHDRDRPHRGDRRLPRHAQAVQGGNSRADRAAVADQLDHTDEPDVLLGGLGRRPVVLPDAVPVAPEPGLAERVVRNMRLWEDPYFNPSRARPDLAGRWLRPRPTKEWWRSSPSPCRGGLQVSPIRNTRLAELGFVARLPEVAARMANAYAEAFIDWGVENRYKSTGRASSFLSSQIEALKQEIQDKDAQPRRSRAAPTSWPSTPVRMWRCSDCRRSTAT